METRILVERYVEDGWYKYGTYNVADASEAKAFVEAIQALRNYDVRVRLVV